MKRSGHCAAFVGFSILTLCATLAFGAETNGLVAATVPADRLAEKNWQGPGFWGRYIGELEKEADAFRASGTVDRVLLGDSITQLWRNAGKDEFAAMKAGRTVLNIGITGDKTQNVLWRIRNTRLLDGYKAKEVVLLVGTNNFNDKDETPENVAEGVKAVLAGVREKQPEAKIVLMAVFPRGATAKDPVRAKIDRLNALIRPLADGKTVRWVDLKWRFLLNDGTLPKTMFPDGLHPSARGYGIWHDALKELDLPAEVNSALVPVAKLEKDGYDWFPRHDRIVAEGKAMNPEILFVGDSITHFWAGRNSIGGEDAMPRWKETFGKYRTLNIGFGWDRIQNALWRLENGEVEGLAPKTIVVNLGTNNTSDTPNARENTPAEVAEGVMAVIAKLHAKMPAAKVVLMNVFPRGTRPTDAIRGKVNAIQSALAVRAAAEKGGWFRFLDIGAKFLEPDGTLPKTLMGDGTHPTDAGYAIWAKELLPLL